MSSDGTASGVEVARRIASATGVAERVRLTADWIREEFDRYYSESRRIPALAREAFEQRRYADSIELSRRRLSMYSERIHALGAALREAFPQVAGEERPWARIRERYLPLVQGRYEEDLALAFFHSVRRKVYQGEWKPVEYAFAERALPPPGTGVPIARRLPCGRRPGPETFAQVLRIPGFATAYRDLEGDARAVAARVAGTLDRIHGEAATARSVEMLDAGLFRNRGAYLVGQVVLEDGAAMPLGLALLNDEDGIFVDAVLTTEADLHNLFSSTLANFHVTNPRYHELSGFLHRIMPARPLGLHYSTIGFNHVGKVAVMNELRGEIARTGEVFDTAIGFRGTVAIGFSTPSSDYNLKVIRDHPTEQYKWGEFRGVDSVLEKYGRVHEINRTGSMLDNIIYYNLRLERAWFAPALLEELLACASRSVSSVGDGVVFRHLIVQRRQTPLPVFLRSASPEDAETVIVNLGYCIKNNAAANIFNKDLDARNYGVSRFHKVYLFDYDALEPFTEVKIRTNADRIEGEEDVPDWVYEDGVVFLPEEVESGLALRDRHLRRAFRDAHGDLATTRYWESIQSELRRGRVPMLRTYPARCKLPGRRLDDGE